MTIVFPTLLFVRGALVLAIALLAVRCLRRAPAALRHAILGAATVAVLAMPLLAMLVPTWHTGTLAPDPVATIASPPALPVAEAAIAAPAGATAVAPPAITAAHAVPWPSIVAIAWLLGVAALAARAGVGALRAQRIARRGTPVDTARAHLAHAWAALGGSSRAPRVVASAEIDAPIVVGAIAPVVVVPRSSSDWTAERWRVVLLHELAHVRRRDGIANLVAQLACCLYWLDPLAWLVARRLREERELAADDAVLRSGARPSTYAEHLLAIATASTGSAPTAALAMAHPSRFEARVIALLDGDRPRHAAGPRRALAVGGAMGLVAAIVACVSPEAAPRAADVPAPGAPKLATDPRIQAAAEEELDRGMAAHAAAGAVAVVIDARTGAVLAVANRGDGDARAARSPGSTLKPFTFAAALEAGVVAPGSRVDCEQGVRTYGDKTLTDASPHGLLDLGEILAVSSNVCTAKIGELLGDRLGAALRRYHLAAPAHIDPRTLEGAAISAGGGIPVSPLDLAAGYTAFADDGTYHAPDGTSERFMSPQTAHAILTMLGRVVTDADGTGHAARIDGVAVAGKTGTAKTGTDRYYASFVGIVPADAPRFVVLVGFDGVSKSGGTVAAPVFAKLASRL